MNEAQIVEITHRAMYIAVVLGTPLLGVCLIVGLIISVFETITQIHEQALAFVPKIAAVLILLLFAGSWMVSQLASFTREVFTMMSNI